jgi:hypothetical protein
MLDAFIANGLTHIFCLQHDSLKIERTVGVSCRLTIKMDWLNRTACKNGCKSQGEPYRKIVFILYLPFKCQKLTSANYFFQLSEF